MKRQGNRNACPRPFLKWLGGKTQSLPELLRAVDAAGSFERYHEPFLGGGALFFALARTERLQKRAYLSDVNQHLIDAYLGVQDDVDSVIQLLELHKERNSESYFKTMRLTIPASLSERAARVIYLNKTCYNGLWRENRSGGFNAPFGHYKNPRICDEDNLRAVAALLSNVRVEARGVSTVGKFARRGDLVYFDPPYVPVSATADFTTYSKEGFDIDAQVSLSSLCARLANRGVKVLLSNSMTDFTLELYRDFYIYEVFANRVVNSRADRRGKVPEALISSFPIASRSARQESRSQANGMRAGLQRLPATQWLRANSYDDVADDIEKIVMCWKRQGKRTRRNWWEVLAGDTRGNPRTVAQKEFPVLRAAQLRQGLPVTANALCRNPKEEAPPVLVTGRVPGQLIR